ncbi:MAG: hypothetical protein ACO3NN_07425 [Candidatus Puniceispirillales bacterium]|jgi:hypothetical protein|nr:hypothetical protein [Alphaproteobacteria bacterium]MDA0916276.1 hypothetical protein [Pseudomonadota bacterium]
MIILRYLSIILSIILLSSPSFAKETKYTCKPKSAAAVRSNGIQVFKITGEEKPVEITIQDGEGLKSGYFLVNRSKYEILDLGTGKAYAFDKNEPWTHIQDIFFLDNNVLSFILAANASITRYLCNQLK